MDGFFLLVETIPRTHWFWAEKPTSVISKKNLAFLLSKLDLMSLGLAMTMLLVLRISLVK
jgi:hypothetical protein